MSIQVNSPFKVSIFAFFCLLLSSLSMAREVPPPPPDWVLDEAVVLSADTKRLIHYYCSENQKATTSQVVVAFFDSLQGEDLNAWTHKVFNTWHIGQKDKDNGVLLALFWRERKLRIEVGYGLEPVLTDAKAKAIIEEKLTPLLKNNETDRAVLEGLRAIFQTIGSPIAVETEKKILVQEPEQQSGAWVLILLFFFIALAVSLGVIYSDEVTLDSTGMTQKRRRRRKGKHSYIPDISISNANHNSVAPDIASDVAEETTKIVLKIAVKLLLSFIGGGGSSGGGGASGSW